MQEIIEAVYNSGGSGVWLRAQDTGQDSKESKCQQSQPPAVTLNNLPNLGARVTSSVKWEQQKQVPLRTVTRWVKHSAQVQWKDTQNL